MTDSTISATEPAAVTLQFPAGPTTSTLTFFRPELSVNGFDSTEKAIAKYLAAGLGTHPVTGGEELAP